MLRHTQIPAFLATSRFECRKTSASTEEVDANLDHNGKGAMVSIVLQGAERDRMVVGLNRQALTQDLIENHWRATMILRADLIPKFGLRYESSMITEG